MIVLTLESFITLVSISLVLGPIAVLSFGTYLYWNGFIQFSGRGWGRFPFSLVSCIVALSLLTYLLCTINPLVCFLTTLKAHAN